MNRPRDVSPSLHFRHEPFALLFQQSLDLAKRQGTLGPQRRLRLALDTTPIFGRGVVKDTYNLVADGIVAVLRDARRPGGRAPWRPRRLRRMGQRRGLRPLRR